MTTKEDLSKFGNSFQENLCRIVLTDRAFADQILEVFKIEFLELKHLRVFLKKIVEYRVKYGVHPTENIMKTIIRTGINEHSESVQTRIRNYFARCLSQPANVDEIAYIKDTALDFCRKQKLKEALHQSVDLIQNSSFDKIAQVINEALNLGSDNDFGYEYIKDFEKRFEIKARDPISTGWPSIDDICKGGHGMGELGVVIAPTGAGKSMVLVHLGAQAIKQGKRVVHYTLELGDTVVASRYDSAITGVQLKDLAFFKEKIYDDVKDIKGSLIVKEYPTKTASVQTLKNHLERMKNRGQTPDMIIVDYADLLKPLTGSKDEKRHQLEGIYEDLRGMAQYYGCPIWTASQTNRSGLNAEIITMESISEAFNKCFVADLIFSVSRTVRDRAANGGRIFVAKNRNGPDGLVYNLFMDTSCVKVKVLGNGVEESSEKPEPPSKVQMVSLREKYKNYKKGIKK